MNIGFVSLVQVCIVSISSAALSLQMELSERHQHANNNNTSTGTDAMLCCDVVLCRQQQALGPILQIRGAQQETGGGGNSLSGSGQESQYVNMLRRECAMRLRTRHLSAERKYTADRDEWAAYVFLCLYTSLGLYNSTSLTLWHMCV